MLEITRTLDTIKNSDRNVSFRFSFQGLFNEIIGPTLQDLKDNLGVDYETVSGALGIKSIGQMVGAIMGGFMHERYYQHSELILACALWLGAISTLIIPLGTHLALVATMFGLSGIGEGLINSGSFRYNIILLSLCTFAYVRM